MELERDLENELDEERDSKYQVDYVYKDGRGMIKLWAIDRYDAKYQIQEYLGTELISAEYELIASR